MKELPTEYVKNRKEYILFKNDIGITEVVRRGDIYEKYIFDYIRNNLQVEGTTIIDIGANFGFHSLEFADLVGKTGKVISFEPQKLIYYQLCGNVILNGYDNITTYNVALSDETTKLKMENLQYKSTGSINIGNAHLNAWTQTGYNYVDVRPLDSFDDIDNVSVIKIDVQGYEPRVLDGAKKLIEKYQPIIFIEVESDQLQVYNWKETDIFDRLQNMGYSCNRLSGVDYVAIPKENQILVKLENQRKENLNYIVKKNSEYDVKETITEKKLTVIMPFLNEEYNPIDTIISINNTVSNPSQIEIIAICDYPTYEYDDIITKFSNVKFIKNKHSIGVDASRSMGINMAKTPAVLVIDGHMRFSHDDWVNKIYDAAITHPKTLWCTRSYVLRDSMTSDELNPMLDVLEVANHYSTGANIRFFDEDEDNKPFGMSWLEKNNFLDTYDGKVPCVLGANYAGNTRWLKHINSFEGMMTWGFSEQYISIKNWLLGGECKGLDTVSIGHIFRSQAPYMKPYKNHVYNMLFTAYTLFSDELDIFNTTIKLIQMDSPNDYKLAMEMLESRWDVLCVYKEKFQSLKVNSLESIFEKFSIPYKEVVNKHK